MREVAEGNMVTVNRHTLLGSLVVLVVAGGSEGYKEGNEASFNGYCL